MCAQAGIIQEFSTTETPQLNGEAERLMRTLVEVARDFVLWRQSACLWKHAMHYYVYAQNLTPRKELDDKILLEIFTKRPEPSLLKFCFGEHVTCYVDDKRRQPTAAQRVDPLGNMQLPFERDNLSSSYDRPTFILLMKEYEYCKTYTV